MRLALPTAVALFAAALAAAQGAAAPIAQGPLPGKRVEVLFLGHTRATEATDPKAGGWYHDSDRFAPMLKAALAPDGFNFSYTTDPTDLNAANLAKYDALLIYANHRRDCAAAGEGAARFRGRWQGAAGRLHSASFCFQNSPAYIALLGAQFEQHGTGEFTAAIRQSLASGAGGAAAVPGLGRDVRSHETQPGSHRPDGADRRRGPRAGTWVRPHGKGRVFYTAYGHDERVWGHPGFHALMKNAMTWAIGVDAAAQLSALAIAPLQYTDGPVPVPNYERRNPAPRLQQPLSTGEAAKHMQIPPGFELQLFAAEPLISGNPEAMAWDERGRLWIAETRDYPEQPAAGRRGQRRHQDPGRHEPRRPGRQGHGLRRQAEHRQQPRLRQRRHHRLAGRTSSSP